MLTESQKSKILLQRGYHFFYDTTIGQLPLKFWTNGKDYPPLLTDKAFSKVWMGK